MKTTMKIQIKHRHTGAVLHEGDYVSMMDAVAGAIKSRANLSWANLSWSNLSGANLSGANLSRSDLSRSNLSGANLSWADLSRADLSGVDLSRSDLSRSDLSRSNLSGANLSWADLSWADLSRSDLSRVDLSGVDLSRANLSWADLSGSDLSRANIDLKALQVQLIIARTRILPEGDLVGWKKLQGGLIAKLLIPAKAKRSHAFGRKCRASCAKVAAIYDGKKLVKDGVSQHDARFKYRVGKIVKPKLPFSDKWMEECNSGIHFYITRIEAENH